ncbi:glycoside hydrolase family 99-like domain-containing protein [Rhodoferax bucti]|uniref:glycoside hydrolase family 99-like domain-containing protein n=1 Tax=Rhodoferax bucti TaxID=2576305 RepID=UPI00110860F7|nr:glycoside hydrolase family 99-like domain-containing protein [Rhodoferax bucti]
MKKLIGALGLALCSLLAQAQTDKYNIGVYYFPGWADNQKGAVFPQPWEKIKPFPEREPKLGWYKEGSDEVTRQHIDWMAEYGINFVAYDWYWGKDNKVFLEHALAAHMRAPNREKVKISLLWANHDGMLASKDNFERMVTYWAKYYFQRPEFLRIEGKPVVFVFYADFLQADAAKFGSSTKALLESAQNIAKQNGLPGIYFVAGTGAASPMIDSFAKDAGYSALSAYNYHQGLYSPIQSHNYEQLDKAYREHWSRFVSKGNLPLVVPMTSGWDKRPWGGSKDPLHDMSFGEPGLFEGHLRAAKATMDSIKTDAPKMGVICCWNEFGEGSYIEPTKKDGFSYLEKVKKVFGTP